MENTPPHHKKAEAHWEEETWAGCPQALEEADLPGRPPPKPEPGMLLCSVPGKTPNPESRRADRAKPSSSEGTVWSPSAGAGEGRGSLTGDRVRAACQQHISGHSHMQTDARRRKEELHRHSSFARGVRPGRLEWGAEAGS